MDVVWKFNANEFSFKKKNVWGVINAYQLLSNHHYEETIEIISSDDHRSIKYLPASIQLCVIVPEGKCKYSGTLLEEDI